jgi:hypothetical protein
MKCPKMEYGFSLENARNCNKVFIGKSNTVSHWTMPKTAIRFLIGKSNTWKTARNRPEVTGT